MIIHGKSASAGIVIGPIRFFTQTDYQPVQKNISDPAFELSRFQSACDALKKKYNLYLESAKADDPVSSIFSAQLVILDDPEFSDHIQNMIREEQVTSEFAIAQTRDYFARILSSVPDEYLAGRAVDIKDIANQLLEELSRASDSCCSMTVPVSPSSGANGQEPFVLFADDLTPSQIMSFDQKTVLAVVLRHGSANSHTTILARAMGIPMVVELEDSEGSALVWDRAEKDILIVDGCTGLVIVSPSAEQQNEYQGKLDTQKKESALLSSFVGQTAVTLSGREIPIYANINGLSDLPSVLSNDAEGIGLFRSEFLFLNAASVPSEEEQFLVYRKVLEAMKGKRVIIRTMDIGSDKVAPCIPHADLHETNPALGCRGIRLSLKCPNLFQTQLRALLRAACYGNLAIMFPMITSLAEVNQIKKYLEEARMSLRAEGVSYADPEFGIMIETPAAALLSDELAKEVDFFSIGTNDLTQYTLAADRQSESVRELYDPHHPAVLRLIELVVQNAHKENCRVGICGELAADLTMTESLVAMGVDELSVVPASVLPLRKRICEMA